MRDEMTFAQWRARFFHENGDWKDLSEVELSKAWDTAWQAGYHEGLHEGMDRY